MFKYCVLLLAAAWLGGCNTVSDAGASSPVKVQAPKKPELDAGPTDLKTNAFVGVYGNKTHDNKGMQVKFGADGTVTVDGSATTAEGTYSAVKNQAQANFTKTNVARFDHVKFDLSSDGKTLTFIGPLAKTVVLQRTQ